MKPVKLIPVSLAAAAVALAGHGSANAEEADEVTRLIRPDNEILFGAGHVSEDNKRFGQYTGLTDEGGVGLLDVRINNRDDDTGTWLKLFGRNLGLESRELRFDHERQGDWGYFVEFNQIPRYTPYTVNTGLAGIGSANQTVNAITAGTGSDQDLKTRRDVVAVGFDKLFAQNFDVKLRFRSEEKTGSRLFGHGAFGNVNFLAEPIDSTTRQWEATLGYTSDNLQLSGGYYGSAYTNNDMLLSVAGSAVATEVTLPPSNEAHQLHLAGGYNFTTTTRGTFKLAYGRALQDEGFVIAPTLNTRSSLDGRVDTTLAQLGLTARPAPKLSLLASLRYEDRDDKTPVEQYIAAGTTTTGFNVPRSLTSTFGKLEASYRLPEGFRLTGGLDLEKRKRNYPDRRSVGYRSETDETTYRLELRRSLSETVNGTLAYLHADRDGTEFQPDSFVSPPSTNNVAPMHWGDRKRDKWRAIVDWAPTDPLSVNVTVEDSDDEYTSRTLGRRSGEARLYSLDVAYTVSDKWQATARASREDTRAFETTRSGTTIWGADMRNLGNSFGVGMRGNPTRRFEFGADVGYARDRGEHQLSNLGVPAAVDSPPDFHYRLTTLRLFGKYALIKDNAGVRVDYAFERWSTDDWLWANWTYSDGTRVLQDPVQKVHFVGVSGFYRW